MDCNIIKDLLPLYVENLTSESSNNAIQEHIKKCGDCKQTLEQLQTDIVPDHCEMDSDSIEKVGNGLIKKVKNNIMQKILVAVLITLMIGIPLGFLCSKIVMFMALTGTISIVAFISAVLISFLICYQKPVLKNRFKSLGNWTLALSIPISLLLCLILSYLTGINNIVRVMILIIFYNIILSTTLRIYAKVKLPKSNSNKQLFVVTFSVIAVIILVITTSVAILERNRVVDNTDLPFLNDTEVIGTWESVDFVKSPEQFKPGKQVSTDNLFLKGMAFFQNGQLNAKFNNSQEGTQTPWLSWTKGSVINKGGDHTVEKYKITEINGSEYMFVEWKSGNYIYFHTPPMYYVLKKETTSK